MIAEVVVVAHTNADHRRDSSRSEPLRAAPGTRETRCVSRVGAWPSTTSPLVASADHRRSTPPASRRVTACSRCGRCLRRVRLRRGDTRRHRPTRRGLDAGGVRPLQRQGSPARRGEQARARRDQQHPARRRSGHPRDRPPVAAARLRSHEGPGRRAALRRDPPTRGGRTPRRVAARKRDAAGNVSPD